MFMALLRFLVSAYCVLVVVAATFAAGAYVWSMFH
jgi:hypothetical protein